MERRKFRGTYGIVLTPFNEDGTVDFSALEHYVKEKADSCHLDGLVVCGSTGEYTRLSFNENIELMKTVKKANTGGKQLIFGATAGDSYTANKYVEAISELNPDGILLAPPYYFKLNDEEILEYYKTVIENNKADLPIIAYNIPQCTNAVSVKVFTELMMFPCVKGFKNSWNDMSEITEEMSIRNKHRKDVAMFTGLDSCLYGTLALGGDGVFSALAYLIPEIISLIYSDYDKNKASFDCQCDLLELINLINRFTFPYGYRVLSEAVGQPLGYGREAVPQNILQLSKQLLPQMRELIEKIYDKYIR